MFLKKFTIAVPLMLVLCLAGCEGNSQTGGGSFDGLKSSKDSVSYSFGMDIAKSFQAQGWDIDAGVMMEGFNAVMGGGQALLTEDQYRQVIMNFQRSEQMAKQAKDAEANKQKGDAFMAQNRSNPAIKEHESGLQYEILAEGSGESPTLDDQVRIHYRGTLLDGTEFDSSYKRGEPAVFQPRGLIKAWQIILPMMKPGAKYKIYSPPGLAYGEFGSPPRIGPNETLIFEMELFEVVK